MLERKFNSRGKLSAVILTNVLSLDFVARFLEDVWLLPLASHVRDHEIVLMAVNEWASLVWQVFGKLLELSGKPMPHNVDIHRLVGKPKCVEDRGRVSWIGVRDRRLPIQDRYPRRLSEILLTPISSILH